MSKQMAFHIEGVGYGGMSGGYACLAFSGGILYRAFCQNTSGCHIYTAAPFDISNDLQNGRNDLTLVNFTGGFARIAIDENFIGSGPVSVTFEIFDRGVTGPAYKVERPNVMVRGVSTGAIAIRTNWSLRPQGTSGTRNVWSRVWRGETTLPAFLTW